MYLRISQNNDENFTVEEFMNWIYKLAFCAIMLVYKSLWRRVVSSVTSESDERTL